MKISAVLITKEKEYPKDIKLEGFDEVIIKTESPSVFQRYIECERAKNDVIYVQDDDVIVDYEELFKHYNGRLTCAMTEHHKKMYEGTGVTLVGWGCYFPKIMLQSLYEYIDRWGIDSLLLREADRAFTYLNQPHNEIIMPHKDLLQKNRMSNEPSHYESAKIMIDKLNLIRCNIQK